MVMALTSGHRNGETGSDSGLTLKVAARIWGWVEFFLNIFICLLQVLVAACRKIFSCIYELLVAGRGI